jgi:hypothetical protein
MARCLQSNSRRDTKKRLTGSSKPNASSWMRKRRAAGSALPVNLHLCTAPRDQFPPDPALEDMPWAAPGPCCEPSYSVKQVLRIMAHKQNTRISCSSNRSRGLHYTSGRGSRTGPTSIHELPRRGLLGNSYPPSCVNRASPWSSWPNRPVPQGKLLTRYCGVG